MANTLLLALPCALVLMVTAYHGPDLPPGPYCGITRECCKNRQDSCSHKILDTLCYCDEHCNRTHDDCCPDYEEVCLGIGPPEPQIDLNRCHRKQTRKEGCNECQCKMTSDGYYDWECENESCMMDADVISGVNRGSYTWRAANYSDFADKKLKDGVIYKLGTLPLSSFTKRMGAIRYDVSDLPEEFNGRQHWPQFISPVIDQQWCGSDWAVVTASVTSDRFAIQSNGAENMVLSPQTFLSCNNKGQRGCKGGNIDNAWNFVRNFGLVDENCFPYKATESNCPFKMHSTLQEAGCIPKVNKRTEKYKVGPPARLKNVEDIMYDIKESGPVHAIMTVYQDFFHYKNGIYRHTNYGDQYLKGLHSVKIVGWGEERGDKYWIVANTWGRQWGEDGYFRIARGSDESGIESFVITVLAEVTEA